MKEALGGDPVGSAHNYRQLCAKREGQCGSRVSFRNMTEKSILSAEKKEGARGERGDNNDYDKDMAHQT
jgi:hypothetical protein